MQSANLEEVGDTVCDLQEKSAEMLERVKQNQLTFMFLRTGRILCSFVRAIDRSL
jgi:hypothetical protein